MRLTEHLHLCLVSAHLAKRKRKNISSSFQVTTLKQMLIKIISKLYRPLLKISNLGLHCFESQSNLQVIMNYVVITCYTFLSQSARTKGPVEFTIKNYKLLFRHPHKLIN